ncbi:MAG: hypothetical protein RL670_887 [Actinomycetota bacterium]
MQWAKEFAPDFVWDQPENSGVRAEDKVRQLLSPELFTVANDRINELEQLTAHQTVALPGAIELTGSAPLGSWTVCTSANRNLGTARLEAAGIRIPKELVTAEDVERGKPHPDPYLLGAKRLGLDPADCVVFEDAPAGVLAGIAAGVGFVVGVSMQAVETAADLVVKSLAGITFDGAELYIPDEIRIR